MTVYKVPQDVEADDKLLGPFSFRQFIYLIAVALGMVAAWALGSLFIPLAIIPVPVILFFGALALPLRKDQPMEVYLAAMVSFYLKPRKRLWQPDGITSLVEITATKSTEVQRTKDLSQSEAERRLSYLANLVDSGGWSVRNVQTDTVVNSSMNSDVYYEAQQAEDILDSTATITRNFNAMIEQNDEKHRQDIISRMTQQVSAAPQPTPAAQMIAPTPTDQPVTTIPTTLNYNPYPDSINQFVLEPLPHTSDPAVAVAQPAIVQNAPTVQQTAAPSTSVKPISPDIINLANQNDLSIETIAREANRINQKELESEEVVVSLR